MNLNELRPLITPDMVNDVVNEFMLLLGVYPEGVMEVSVRPDGIRVIRYVEDHEHNGTCKPHGNGCMVGQLIRLERTQNER